MTGLVAGLESYWLFRPFEEFDLLTVALWWAVPFGILLASSLLRMAMGLEPPEYDVFPDDMGTAGKLLSAVLITPVVEELLFRIGPVWLDVSFEMMLLATVVWVVLHGKRMFIIALFAPLYLKLALGGFLIHCIVIHGFHNLIATIAYIYEREDSEPETVDIGEDFSLTDPDTWPDEWDE